MDDDNEFNLIFKLREYDTALFTLGAKDTYSYFIEDYPEYAPLGKEIREYFEKKEVYMNAEFVVHTKQRELEGSGEYGGFSPLV